MEPNLKEKAIKGVRWTSLTAVGTVILQLVQIIWLARLLSPTEFGLMAMLMVVLRISMPLMQGGLIQAIIQDQEITHVQLSSLYWVNVLLGVLVFLVLLGVSPLIVWFFQEPQLQNLLPVAGLAFLIAPWGSQYQALFTKQLLFNRLAGIQLSAHIVEFAVAIGTALAGAGVWALVWGYLSRLSWMSILNILLGYREHRPLFVLQLQQIRKQLRFGAFEAANQVANILSAQVDKAIIGRMLGAEMLGIYSIAWELVMVPIARINPIITRVAFPVYARLQKQPNVLTNYYTKAVSLLMLVNLPLLIGLGLVAEEFLFLFYGPQWSTGALTLSLLSITAIIKAFGNPGGGVILAMGRSDLSFYWNIVWSICIAALIWGFLKWNPVVEWAALAQLCGAYTIALYWHFLVARVGRINYRPLLYQTGKWLLFCIPMAVAVWWTGSWIEPLSWRLAVKIGTGILVFLLTLWIGARKEIQSFRQLLFSSQTT